MKKFHWPLQRLLDVTLQREQVARMELLALSRELAKVRGEIMHRQSRLRTLLEDLAAQELLVRMARHDSVMRTSAAIERELEVLRESIRKLEEQRRQKTAAFMKLRSQRQTLEKLRQEARERYLKEQLVLEQKQLDESAGMSFARKQLAAVRKASCV